MSRFCGGIPLPQFTTMSSAPGWFRITGLRPGEKLHEELAAPDEKVIPTGIGKVNLLDTGVARLPESVATAIEEERIEDVMAYLKSEIIVVDLEAEVALDSAQPVAEGGVRLGILGGTGGAGLIGFAPRREECWSALFGYR